MKRWLLGEHLKKELYRGEEVQNQGDFPVCPLSIAHSALLDTHCTSSTLTPIKVDSEWKSRKGGIYLPTFSKVGQVDRAREMEHTARGELDRVLVCPREGKRGHCTTETPARPCLFLLQQSTLKNTFMYIVSLCVYRRI